MIDKDFCTHENVTLWCVRSFHYDVIDATVNIKVARHYTVVKIRKKINITLLWDFSRVKVQINNYE